MFKKVTLILCLMVSLISLTGCWDYKDTNNLMIVAGVAIDLNEDDTYHLTAEIIKVSSGKDNKIESKKVDADGKTLFDAVRNMILISGRQLYWSHAKIIIISEDVAKKGVEPIVDLFMRDSELRTSIHVLISKQPTAKEILQQKSITNEIVSYEIQTMLKSQKSQLYINDMTLYQFIIDYSGEGVSGILPAIEVVKNDNYDTTQISGVGMFDQAQFVGYLSQKNGKIIQFIRNTVQKGLYIVEVPENQIDSHVTLEIKENKTSIKPILKDGSLSMQIDVQTKVSIGEHGVSFNYLDEEGRKQLEQLAEQQLKKDIENLVFLVQNDYIVDIFGFGRMTKANEPAFWKQNQEDWKIIFKSLEIDVTTKFEIINSGLLREKIEGED